MQMMNISSCAKSGCTKILHLIFSGYLLLNILTCSADALDLNQYKGKVVYIDFWATWCKPCLQSFPWMEKLEKKYAGKNFIVITVNVDTDKKLAQQFLKKYPLKAKTFFDTHGKMTSAFNIHAMPSSFLYNANGEMAGKFTGFNENKAKLIEDTIIQLLK